MLPTLGVAEIGIIIFLAILIFGPRQLPKLGRAAGETIREFRNIGKVIEGETEDK